MTTNALETHRDRGTALFEEAYPKLAKLLPPDDEQLVLLKYHWTEAQCNLGNTEHAIRSQRELAAEHARRAGPTDATTLSMKHHLAVMLLSGNDRNSITEARAILSAIFRPLRQRYGDDRPYTRSTLGLLATCEERLRAA